MNNYGVACGDYFKWCCRLRKACEKLTRKDIRGNSKLDCKKNNTEHSKPRNRGKKIWYLK